MLSFLIHLRHRVGQKGTYFLFANQTVPIGRFTSSPSLEDSSLER